jgi:hypothetical protein
MTHDPFNDPFGCGRGLKQIDKQCLLACIPDELSLGLTEEEIQKEYGKRCGRLFHIEDFHEALRQLAEDEVRTTHRTTVGGKKVPLYRRSGSVAVKCTGSAGKLLDIGS